MLLHRDYETTSVTLPKRPKLSEIDQLTVRKLIEQGYTMTQIIADLRRDPKLVAQAVPMKYFVARREEYLRRKENGEDLEEILEDMGICSYTRKFLPNAYSEQLSCLEFTFS